MSIQTFIVSRDDRVYEAFPDVTLTADKTKMIAVYLTCNSHLERGHTRIMMTESVDRGRSWSPPHPFTELTETEGLTYNCPRISTLPDGRLAVICDKWVAEGVTAVYVWFSADNGTTWSAPKKTPATGIVPDCYRVLSCGRHIISTHEENQNTKHLEQSLWYSDDGGLTWSEKVTIASDERYHLCEGNILELSDETLVCFLRENSMLGIDCLKAFSYDGGAHWQGLVHTAIPACHRPVAGFLKNGNILMTYRFLQGGGRGFGHNTQNFMCAYFDEESAACQTREAFRCAILPLDHDRNPIITDLGYSGWVEFEDGELYAVNYIIDDAPKAHIRGYSFRKEDIVL